MSLQLILLQIGIAVGLVGGAVLALEAGFRAGRRTASHRQAGEASQIGATVQGAILGLVALLLGFSFAGSATRFIDRQELVVREANAIGTAYLRADLLDEPYRSALREALHGYTQHRIEKSAAFAIGAAPSALAEVEQFHHSIWRAACEGVTARPAFGVLVLLPVNEVIDLHASRLAAFQRHLPHLVMALLIASAAAALVAIGYGYGLAGRRQMVITGTLAFLIAAALWATIDLDYPRVGLIRMSDSPLRELQFASHTQQAERDGSTLKP